MLAVEDVSSPSHEDFERRESMASIAVISFEARMLLLLAFGGVVVAPVVSLASEVVQDTATVLRAGLAVVMG